MKIMILANDSVGLYKFRSELIKELIKDNEIVILSPTGMFIDELKDIGCKCIDIPIDRRGINPLKDIKLLNSYKKLLKKEMPNLVITYTIKPNVYGGLVCRVLKIPYAINITGLGTAFENDGIIKQIVILMYKISCKNAKIVFFENEANRQLFIKERIVKPTQTYRLNGAGVNLDYYKKIDYPKGEKIKFLFMGRVMAEKGVNELFNAMERLISDGYNCELNVLGGYEEDYENIIINFEKAGWLHYYGFQQDVRPFIGNCHCFVLPSWHEGMANTNLESAASGRPVITSNIHGCLEAIEDNVTGYLVEKKNANSLYTCMKKFCDMSLQERERMGELARIRMEKKFDKRVIVQETINNLFEE